MIRNKRGRILRSKMLLWRGKTARMRVNPKARRYRTSQFSTGNHRHQTLARQVSGQGRHRERLLYCTRFPRCANLYQPRHRRRPPRRRTSPCTNRRRPQPIQNRPKSKSTNSQREAVKDWEIIADNLHDAGWSLGWVSAVILKGERSGLWTLM